MKKIYVICIIWISTLGIASAQDGITTIDSNDPGISVSDRSEELYFKGRRDASQYYKGNGAMWGTFGGTILFAPVGLVTGVIIGVVPPNVENTVPDYKLLKELEYREGYTKKAKGRKWGKVALGFGMGLATNILVYSLITGAK